MLNMFRGLFGFGRKCLELLSGERNLYILFLILSLVMALTEGFGVSMVAPLLDLQAGSNFTRVPLLGNLTSAFANMPPGQRIPMIALVLAIVVVFRGAIQFAVDALSAIIPLRVQRRLSLSGYSALMGVQLGFIQASNVGDLSNGISSYPTRVTQLLQQFATALWNFCIMLVYIALMFAMSWRMTICSIIFVLVISLILKKFATQPLKRAGKAITNASAQVGMVVHETLNGMKLIRLSVAEDLMIHRYSVSLNANVSALTRLNLIAAASSPLLTTGAGLFICSLLLGNQYLHMSGDMSWVSGLILFLIVLFRLLGPVSQINMARSRILGDIHAFEMLEQFQQQTREHRQPSGHQLIHQLKSGICFQAVDFRYPGIEELALQGLSTEIPCGKMVAIIGPSGAGKSTIVGMVARFYDVAAGRILVDGVDLRDLDIDSWRRRISVVSQDIFIFNDTVTNNIKFGMGEVSFEQVQAAAKLAAAEEFIEKLPEGYETLLGDRGVRLSGGQQQRIAIARAILANPDLLILDEATSNLDTYTERAIQSAVDQLSKNRTMLIIAHRLSTIRKADKVIVLKDGRIVEEGRHDELLKKQGVYWEMVEHQRLDLVDDAVAEVSPS